MVAGGDTAQPVLLLGENARRIGVTFAVATVDPMGRDVRTVGQVTFDESNVTTISPKIDGWVERLHVDVTGQPVTKGEPMLSVYSPMLVMAQEELLLAKRLENEMGAAGADARRNVEELIASARRRLAYWDVPPSEIARVERTGQVERTLTLNAPVSGIIIDKNVLQGQRIMAGDALYRVADLTTVWVEGDVFEPCGWDFR
jgi:Cu(I)/Ag(I) efflux system membrane fusion protein